MKIKSATDRQDELETLQRLLEHPQASERQRSQIELEIRMLRAGIRGEAETAYELDFHLRDSTNWAVLHDLRIEHAGRVAQIDHLLINRFLECWVCESKHFSEGVAVNAQGEFTAFFNGRPRGVPSPIAQNERHIDVLEALMNSPTFPLPKRLGMTLRPSFISLVVVSKGARIQRPTPTPPAFQGILKSDQVWQYIQRDMDRASLVSVAGCLSKLVGSDTLRSLAEGLAGQHRPIRVDWAAKFGLDALPRQAAPRPRAQPEDLGPAAGPADQATNDPHRGRLSTSRLASRLGLRGGTGEALKTLRAAGYLQPEGDRDVLTAKALAAGACFVEKSRFGPYFLWPENLPL